jgi:hypothetical protein
VVTLEEALKNVAGVKAGGYHRGWDYYRIRGFDASFTTFIDRIYYGFPLPAKGTVPPNLNGELPIERYTGETKA